MSDLVRTQKFLDNQKYMTVAVVLEDGTPWATPVKIQARGEDYFEWDSRTDTEHSRAITLDPAVAISLFEVKEDGHFGYYARAEVTSVTELDTDRARYHATVMKAWINDETFVKREVGHDS